MAFEDVGVQEEYMKTKIFNIVREFSMREEFSYDESLSDLGIDSMSTIDMILELESELDITIPDEMLTEKSFDSVNKIYQTVVDIQS